MEEVQMQKGYVISDTLREELLVLLRNGVHPHKTWQDILNIINALMSSKLVNISTVVASQGPTVQQEDDQE